MKKVLIYSTNEMTGKEIKNSLIFSVSKDKKTNYSIKMFNEKTNEVVYYLLSESEVRAIKRLNDSIYYKVMANKDLTIMGIHYGHNTNTRQVKKVFNVYNRLNTDKDDKNYMKGQLSFFDC